MTPPIQPHQQVVQTPRLAFRVIETKGVLVQPKQQMAHILNPVGAFIWEKIREPKALSALAGEVAAQFAISDDTALADCQDFLADLQGKGLIEVKG